MSQCSKNLRIRTIVRIRTAVRYVKIEPTPSAVGRIRKCLLSMAGPCEANDDKSKKVPSETAITGGLFSSVLGPLSQQLVLLLFLLRFSSHNRIQCISPIYLTTKNNRRLCFE